MSFASMKVAFVLLLAASASSGEKKAIASQAYVDDAITLNVTSLSSRLDAVEGSIDDTKVSINRVNNDGEKGEAIKTLQVNGEGDTLYTKVAVDGLFASHSHGEYPTVNNVDKTSNDAKTFADGLMLPSSKYMEEKMGNYLALEKLLNSTEEDDDKKGKVYSAKKTDDLLGGKADGGHLHDGKYVQLKKVVGYDNGKKEDVYYGDGKEMDDDNIPTRKKMDNVLTAYVEREKVDYFKENLNDKQDEDFRLLSRKYIEEKFYAKTNGSQLEGRVKTLEGKNYDDFLKKGNIITKKEEEGNDMNKGSDSHFYSAAASNAHFAAAEHDHRNKYPTVDNIVDFDNGKDSKPGNFYEVKIPTVKKVEAMLSSSVVTSSSIFVDADVRNKHVSVYFRILDGWGGYVDDFSFIGVLPSSPVAIREGLQLLYTYDGSFQQTSFSLSDKSNFKFDDSCISIVVF